MRVKSKVNVRIFDDANERDCLFGPDDARAEVTHTNVAEYAGGKFEIDADTTVELSLGTVNEAYGVYIRALGDFNVVVNSSDPALPVRRAAGLSANTPVKFYMDGAVSSVAIRNTSETTPLVGMYVVWGDA